MRVRVGLATSVMLTGLCVGVTSGPATGAGADYTALGDSYAAGVGTREYRSDSGECLRSDHAYPVIDAARVGAILTFVACSGATTVSVRDTQLGSLSAATDLVSVSAGGNDAGFVEVVTECATPWWAGNCDRAADEAQAFIRSTLPGRLDSLYAAIRAAAPAARVVVVGYPRLFMGEDCNAGTWFSPAEQQRLNQTADLLASVTAGRASAHGFTFVDPRAAFTGHAVCDDPEWVNGLSSPVRESYHPNRSGQLGYASLVDDHLVG